MTPDSRNSRDQSTAEAFICRCEELTVADVETAIAEGHRTLNDVKRRTRAGMGACQGVYCLSEVRALLQTVPGDCGLEMEPMTARPPARSVTLAQLSAVED